MLDLVGLGVGVGVVRHLRSGCVAPFVYVPYLMQVRTRKSLSRLVKCHATLLSPESNPLPPSVSVG